MKINYREKYVHKVITTIIIITISRFRNQGESIPHFSLKHAHTQHSHYRSSSQEGKPANTCVSQCLVYFTFFFRPKWEKISLST